MGERAENGGEFAEIALAKIGAEGQLLELRSRLSREDADAILREEASGGKWVAIPGGAAAELLAALVAEDEDAALAAGALARSLSLGHAPAAEERDAFWTAPARRELRPRRRVDGSRM